MAAEPATTDVPTHETEVHERDYAGFTKLLKFGTIASFVVGMIVVLIIAN